MSLLEKIRMLNKEQLIIVIRENGFEGIAEILEDKDITGQTFLNLPTFQLISWNLSIRAMKTLTKFIEQVKNNPQILNRNNLLKAYQEKQEFSTNTSVKVKSSQNIDAQKSSHLNDFKNKLAITLNSEKSYWFQKPPMIDRDLLTNKESNTILQDPSEFHMKPKPVLPLPKVREKIPTPRIHQIPFVRGKNSEYPDSDFIVDVNDTQNNYTRYIKDQSKRSAMCQNPLSYSEDNSSSLNIRKRLLTPTEVQGNLEIPEDINMSTEDLKFISHSNNNTYPSSYRQNLPTPVEVSINRFKNIEPLPSNLTKMIPDHEGITRLYKKPLVEDTDILNKTKNVSKSPARIFNTPGNLIERRPLKTYENHHIDDNNPNRLDQDPIEFYKNRPLPPVPRDEEIISCVNSNKTDRRVPKSLDDNLIRRNVIHGNATRRSVDFNNERFFRNTDRRGAERLLMNLRDGAFLFRPSKKYYLALTIKYKQSFYNFGIERTSKMTIRLNADTNNVAPEFRTLRDFTEYFTIEPISFKNEDELVDIILEPVLPDNFN